MHIRFVVQWRNTTQQTGIGVYFNIFVVEAMRVSDISILVGMTSKSRIIGAEKTAVVPPWKHQRKMFFRNDVVVE